jgi:hypothetical protein
VQKFSRGRLLAGCVIGVVCGLMLPLLSMFSAWVLPVTVIFALLWVWAGWPAVLVGAISVVMSGLRYWFLGWGFSAAILLLALPGVLAAVLTGLKKPFYRAVGYSVVMQLAALVLLTAIAWLIFRQNLVDVITSALREMIKDIPAARQHFLMLQLGQLGFFGDNTGINFSKAILTDAQLKSLIDQLFYEINAGLKQSLPAYVLATGTVTGALSYVGAAWVRVRSGNNPDIPFVKPDGWRLNADLIIGPPVLALVCLGLGWLGLDGADAAYVALINLAQLLFTVQAVGALERRMKTAGVAPGQRTALAVVALVIGYRLMPLLGMYSALFGSQGLISKQIRKRMDGKGDE